MKIQRISKTPPTVPFEKKKDYVIVDCAFFDKKGNYKEDWQLVRVDETKRK